jgi:peroxiredoxin
MPAGIGATAPPFTLPGPDRSLVSLADLRGRPALIVFIPFPFTGTCSAELCTLRDNLAALEDLDAAVVAVSCDTVFANAEWSRQNGFGFPVLSDFWPHGDVSKAYGTFDERTGSANRTTFLIDGDGVVREVIASGSLGTPREYDEYVAALQRLRD